MARAKDAGLVRRAVRSTPSKPGAFVKSDSLVLKGSA